MAVYDVCGRSAIVTGAGSGIGRSIALLLADNGAAVIVNDLDGDHAASVVARSGCRRHRRGIRRRCDGYRVDRASVAAANALAPLESR